MLDVFFCKNKTSDMRYELFQDKEYITKIFLFFKKYFFPQLSFKFLMTFSLLDAIVLKKEKS